MRAERHAERCIVSQGTFMDRAPAINHISIASPTFTTSRCTASGSHQAAGCAHPATSCCTTTSQTLGLKPIASQQAPCITNQGAQQMLHMCTTQLSGNNLPCTSTSCGLTIHTQCRSIMHGCIRRLALHFLSLRPLLLLAADCFRLWRAAAGTGSCRRHPSQRAGRLLLRCHPAASSPPRCPARSSSGPRLQCSVGPG